MHPVDGAKMKLIRAQDHLKAIRSEIARLEHERPYRIIREPDPAVGGEVIRYEPDLHEAVHD